MRRQVLWLILFSCSMLGCLGASVHAADQDEQGNVQKSVDSASKKPAESPASRAVNPAKRDLDKEVADSTEAIRRDPKDAKAYSDRADAYCGKRDYDNAIADYSEAVKLDSKRVAAYLDRGFIYGIKSDWDKAMADAVEAVRLDPKSHIAYNHVGVAYDGYAKKLSSIDEKAAELLFDRAAGYFDGPPKKLDGAQQRLPFDGSVDNFRTAARKLDRAHKVQLLFDYSAAYFKAAIDIKPDYDFGNNNLGVYYARRGGPEDMKLAESYFRSAVRTNPRYADAFNNLGIVLARQGKLDEAIASHKACLALRGDRAPDHNNLCRVYMQKKDYESAMEENDIAQRCDPNFLGAWLSRVEIEIAQKDDEESRECVLRMIAIDAKSGATIEAESLFVENCLKIHRPEDAIELLSESLKLSPAVPQVYKLRATVYVKKGDLIHAREDAEQILEIEPSFPGGKELLQSIKSKLDTQPK